jgi:hypothetical protein
MVKTTQIRNQTNAYIRLAPRPATGAADAARADDASTTTMMEPGNGLGLK